MRTEKAVILILTALMSPDVFGAATQIPDPAKFVSDVYARFVASDSYRAPEDIYTPRLKALLENDKRQANGEVGCIEFDFWVNGQDWKLSNVRVTGQDVPNRPNGKLVIATFVSIGQREEIHFDFLRVGGRWLLDDVHSVKDPRWTLSELLKCRP
jgi:hypothetical protein